MVSTFLFCTTHFKEAGTDRSCDFAVFLSFDHLISLSVQNKNVGRVVYSCTHIALHSWTQCQDATKEKDRLIAEHIHQGMEIAQLVLVASHRQWLADDMCSICCCRHPIQCCYRRLCRRHDVLPSALSHHMFIQFFVCTPLSSSAKRQIGQLSSVSHPPHRYSLTNNLFVCHHIRINTIIIFLTSLHHHYPHHLVVCCLPFVISYAWI